MVMYKTSKFFGPGFSPLQTLVWFSFLTYYLLFMFETISMPGVSQDVPANASLLTY